MEEQRAPHGRVARLANAEPGRDRREPPPRLGVRAAGHPRERVQQPDVDSGVEGHRPSMRPADAHDRNDPHRIKRACFQVTPQHPDSHWASRLLLETQAACAGGRPIACGGRVRRLRGVSALAHAAGSRLRSSVTAGVADSARVAFRRRGVMVDRDAGTHDPVRRIGAAEDAGAHPHTCHGGTRLPSRTSSYPGARVRSVQERAVSTGSGSERAGLPQAAPASAEPGRAFARPEAGRRRGAGRSGSGVPLAGRVTGRAGRPGPRGPRAGCPCPRLPRRHAPGTSRGRASEGPREPDRRALWSGA